MNLTVLPTKIYTFKVYQNYDPVGVDATTLETVKTKFLVCSDFAEEGGNNSNYLYLVLRPRYLWNSLSPKNYTGSTSTGDYPVHPVYTVGDKIQVISTYIEETGHYDLFDGLTAGEKTSLVSYLDGFRTGGKEIFNWDEINHPTAALKKCICYFVDVNNDARTREIAGNAAGCIPLIVSGPNMFPPPGTKTAIVKSEVLKHHVPMYCVESTLVVFQDTKTFELKKKEEIFEADKIFEELCEPGSLYVSSYTVNEPEPIGVQIVSSSIIIKKKTNKPLKCTMTISGIRKGMGFNKYHRISKEAAEKNSKFWDNWKS